jgi:hypothetical protein
MSRTPAGTFRIFGGGELSEYLGKRLRAIEAEVLNASTDYLLNTNESQYIDYLLDKYTVPSLTISFEGLSVTTREELIPAEWFPSSFAFNVRRGESYLKQVITYHLPFAGNQDLLTLRPSNRIIWSTDVRIVQGAVLFDVVNWKNNPQEIKSEADRTISNIRQQAALADCEVAGFGQSLNSTVSHAVRERKAQLLKQLNLLSALGVPVKRAENVPSTFAVPVAKKVLTIAPPAASAGSFKPEPALDSATYEDVLRIVGHAGVEMERHPSIYKDKGEESLRDHFIMVLAPHFESATGETFNKKGKTDILIRHENANVFVAECKFWSGLKAYYGTIDQILSYLTWRDSKAAVIVFVGNKQLSPVLEQIRDGTAKHECFVKAHGEKREGQFRFEFHLPGDNGRSVQLAVLVFHFPE